MFCIMLSGTPLNQFIKKLQECKDSEYALPSAPVDWALANKRKVDVFINLFNHYQYALVPEEIRRCKVGESLAAYNKEIGENAK